MTAYGDASKNIVTLYDFGNEGTTHFVSQAAQQPQPVYQDTANTPDADSDPIADQWDESRPTSFENTMGTLKSPFDFGDDTPGYRSPFADDSPCKRSVDGSISRRCAAGTGTGVTDIALARVSGALSTVTLISSTAAEAAGLAAAAVGVAFIVLDFANGNWLGGAIGAIV